MIRRFLAACALAVAAAGCSQDDAVSAVPAANAKVADRNFVEHSTTADHPVTLELYTDFI